MTGNSPSDAEKTAAPHTRHEPPTPIVSYTLSARLDEQKHEVSGSGSIAFTNISPDEVTELYFHLYLNAFENDETLFLRTTGGRSGVKKGRPGSIEVLSLRSPSFEGIELWQLADKHSPQDPKDRTDIRVQLPGPVLPGATLLLEIEFKSQLPEIVERTGFYSDFHFVGQWFPKLAKHNPDGSWSHFSFHPYAEFYANFGNYDVTFEVPEDYIVGSTGEIVSQVTQGGRSTYRALAPAVHDFAWTAWPGFRESTRLIEGVKVRLLVPRGSPKLEKVTFQTAKSGLKHLNQAYGQYPYSTLTIVQPPLGAMRAGGMEYPGIITTRGTEASTRTPIRSHELVTIHEMAHLWFHGTIASNESAFPFLDEGVASYAEWRYLEESYGPGSFFDLAGLQISRTAAGRFTHFSSPQKQAIALPARKFSSFSAVASLVYARSALCLTTLARVYGESQFHEALRRYALKWRFAHPTPTDFFESLEDGLGANARIEAERMFRRRGSVDFSVEAPETTPLSSGFRSKLTVLKRGSLRLPTSLAIELEDGVVISRKVSGRKKRTVFTVDHFSPIHQLIVDPERKVLLDENLLNNRHRVHPENRVQQGQAALAIASWLSLLGAI